MSGRYSTFLAAVLVILLSASAAFAQAPLRSVLDNYQKGENAIKQKQWDAAIAALTAAVAQDPKDRPYRDGAFSGGYFPHHYLVIAYSEKGDLVKARASMAVRGPLPNDLVAQEAPYVAKLNAPAGPSTPANTGTPVNPTASVNPAEQEFADLNAAGQAAFNGQQFQQAIDNWDRACTRLPDECARLGLRQKIADTRTRLAEAQAAAQRNAAINTARAHVASGQTLIGEGKLDDARKEFKAALDADPNNQDAVGGTKAIQDRETGYAAAKARAEQFAKANKLDEAMREYDVARTAHGELFHRDKLEDTVAAINKQFIETQGAAAVAAQAQKAFQDGHFEAAKQAAEAVLVRDVNNATMKSLVTRSESRILSEDGRKLAAAGDYLQSDDKFKEALKKDAGNDLATKALKTSATYQGFVGQKLFPQARNTDRIRFDREQPDQNFEKLDALKAANESFANSDFGSARKRIDEVVKRDPTNMAALSLQRRITAASAAARAADAANAPVAAPVALTQTAPLLPMWMWVSMAAVAVFGAGSLVLLRGRTPTPVAIDALPWGRVSIQIEGRPAKAAPTEKITPFSISLPPGEYDLQVTSESSSQPYATKIRVVRGQANKFVVTMPAYDVDEILSSLLG